MKTEHLVLLLITLTGIILISGCTGELPLEKPAPSVQIIQIGKGLPPEIPLLIDGKAEPKEWDDAECTALELDGLEGRGCVKTDCEQLYILTEIEDIVCNDNDLGWIVFDDNDGKYFEEGDTGVDTLEGSFYYEALFELFYYDSNVVFTHSCENGFFVAEMAVPLELVNQIDNKVIYKQGFDDADSALTYTSEQLEYSLNHCKVKDSDGDGLTDSYEIEWGLDPNNPDEDGNDILDGYDDFDGDLFLANSEMLIWSDPLNPESPDLSEMMDVTDKIVGPTTGPKEPPEILELPKKGEVYCRVMCCCEVHAHGTGKCTEWSSSVPQVKVSTKYGEYKHSNPANCTKRDSKVIGYYWRDDGNKKSGPYSCLDVLRWQYRVRGIGKECEDFEKLCKEKFEPKCAKNEPKAEKSTDKALRDCVNAAAKACVGSFTTERSVISQVKEGKCT